MTPVVSNFFDFLITTRDQDIGRVWYQMLDFEAKSKVCLYFVQCMLILSPKYNYTFPKVCLYFSQSITILFSAYAYTLQGAGKTLKSITCASTNCQHCRMAEAMDVGSIKRHSEGIISSPYRSI